jgi:hypothetical protein
VTRNLLQQLRLIAFEGSASLLRQQIAIDVPVPTSKKIASRRLPRSATSHDAQGREPRYGRDGSWAKPSGARTHREWVSCRRIPYHHPGDGILYKPAPPGRTTAPKSAILSDGALLASAWVAAGSGHPEFACLGRRLLTEGALHRKITTALTGVSLLLLTSGVALAGPTAPIAVPEPASLSLLAAGIGALALARYFRGK